MKKLFFITNIFPFGKKGESFIENEEPFLEQAFDVTIVSSGMEYSINRLGANSSAKVIRLVNDGCSLCFFIKALASKLFWKEVVYIKKNHKQFIKANLASLRYLCLALKFKSFLGKFVKKENICDDNLIIYTFWYTAQTLGASLFKSDGHNEIKVITRVHGFDLYEERSSILYQPYRKATDMMIDKISFVSQLGREYYVNRFENGIYTDKFVLNYLGVKKHDKRDNYSVNKKFKLVSCSSVISLKRVDLIIDVLADIDRYDIEWTHFGDGDLFDQIRLYAEKKLLKKDNISFIFKGRQDNLLIHKAYVIENYDCFITASSTEGGVPVSMQEALCYGIPCIGTDVGGVSELIGNDCGILLHTNPAISEVKEALNYMYRLTRDLDGKLEIAHRCCSKWESTFNAKRNYTQFVNMLKEL